MLTSIRSLWEKFRGAGEAAPSVPSMDGAFNPNQQIEEAPVLLTWETPDNLAVAGKRLFFSSDDNVFEITTSGSAELVARGSQPITALAGAPDGTLAIARSSAGLSFAFGLGERSALTSIGGKIGDITAMAFTAAGDLALTIASEAYRVHDWRRDFLTRGRTGSAWLLSPQREPVLLADRLAYASGIAPATEGDFLVSESWTSAISIARAGTRPTPIVSNMPAYPSRIIRASNGGYWLALFAPRNQLIEFAMREPVFCARMMKEVEPEFWLAPMLRPANTPMDPMLRGVQRFGGGQINPWAPSLSYGLVAKLDEAGAPDFTFHSRANGLRHGVTSIVEHGGALLAASRCGYIVTLPTDIGTLS
jgi:hypothetical protein